MRRGNIAAAVRRAAGNIHLVDKCLMVFMAVLLVQSAVSLFFPGDAGGAGGSIDVIVRTSSAAIFGYFLSANFNRRPDAAGEEGGGEGEPPPPYAGGKEAPRARIGFQPPEEGEEPVRVPPPRLRAGGGLDEPCNLQVLTAWVIGLFCLLVLLLLRGTGMPEGGSATATVAQFRDFVSGCVGFLIGCPTRGAGQS